MSEIDNDTLWSIVQQDVPALLPKLRALRDAAQINLEPGASNDHE